MTNVMRFGSLLVMADRSDLRLALPGRRSAPRIERSLP
jgi:hypothetical protein